MGLEIVGAGFGRTGTMSLKFALEKLGFGPCHHMADVIRNPEQGALWRELAAGAEPDFDRLFDGYRAQVDWPGAVYWRELAQYFPESRVILTVRDPDAWHQSVMNTIGRHLEAAQSPDAHAAAQIGYALINRPVFGGRVKERDHAVAVFEAHVRQVREVIPASRLLVMETGAGWEPLCDFLGVAVPDEPYPASNSTAEFLNRASAPPPL